MGSETEVDTRFLQSLLGYNARRVALVAIDQFVTGMKEFGLRPVDFSILSVVQYNPGITSRALCRSLNLQPPNLVKKVAHFEAMGWLDRTQSETDKRAIDLTLTKAGVVMMRQAEMRAAKIELEVASVLTPHQQATLIALLQKVYAGRTTSESETLD